jgi:hypothetical protein
MKEIDQSMMQATPKIIVTSKSSTSINNNSIHYSNTLHPPPLCYSTATSSSNELLDEKPKPKYLISSSSSSVNSAVIKSQNESNNNVFVAANPKQTAPTESKYGKIQPINKYMSKYRFFSKNSSIDRYNGNSSDDFCTLPNVEAVKTVPKNPPKPENPMTEVNRQPKAYRYGSNVNTLTPPTTQHQSQTLGKLGYSVINHVSSPESAYSTGYSTDGNSPGEAKISFFMTFFFSSFVVKFSHVSSPR